MANELQFKSAISLGYEAAEALDAYIGVTLNTTTNKVSKPGSAGARIIGITRRAAAAGEMIEIFVDAVCPIKVKTASGLSANSLVGFHTDGGAYLPAGSSGLFAGARLLAAPAANGDIVAGYVSLAIDNTF